MDSGKEWGSPHPVVGKEKIMGLSNVMWGYVAAKGKLSVREDPDSEYNAKAIKNIARFARIIDTMPRDVTENHFMGHPVTGSYLRGLVLETDLENRFGMATILEKIGSNGTIVVPSIKHLSRSGSSCEAELHILNQIAGNAISVIVLNDPIFAHFLQIGSQKLTKFDLSKLAQSGIGGWVNLQQRLTGLKYANAIADLKTELKPQQNGFKYLSYRDGAVYPERIATLIDPGIPRSQ